ncbi:MAG: DctP family TRAP transporter solute-binding subunit [Aminivibrio sp.]|nr:DctP family TRAP transporter solute-binding subunit [Aminivibrio sp.]
MKKIVALLIAVAVLCSVSVPAFAAYKDEYKLDIVPSLTTAWGMGAQYFTDLVKERSGGKINIKVYPGSQLTTGKQTNAFLLVRNGTIDFAVQSSINYSPQLVELNLFALPFFIANQPDRYAALDAIKAGKAGEMVIKAIEDKGVKFLGFGENGFRELTNSRKAIRTPDDLAGMKIRVVGSPLFLDTFRALGANPVNMNWSDTMAAIQQGVVDGQENPISTFFPVKMHDFHKFMTDWHYVVDPTLFVVNPGVWGSFSAEDQKMIQEAAVEAGKYQIALARIGLDDGTAQKYLEGIGKVPEITDWYGTLKSVGMDVAILTPEETKAFADKTAPVLEAWRSKVGEELVKAAEADMAAAVKK